MKKQEASKKQNISVKTASLLSCFPSSVQINGIDANFFDLGGHSLLATQITFQINKTFNVSKRTLRLPLLLLLSLLLLLAPPSPPCFFSSPFSLLPFLSLSLLFCSLLTLRSSPSSDPIPSRSVIPSANHRGCRGSDRADSQQRRSELRCVSHRSCEGSFPRGRDSSPCWCDCDCCGARQGHPKSVPHWSDGYVPYTTPQVAFLIRFACRLPWLVPHQ